MGNFYVNFTTHGTNRDQILRCLKELRRNAFVGPTIDGVTVFYDHDADSQDDHKISELGCAVSKSLACPVLAVANHDDAILYYWLVQDGKLACAYDSYPGYFDDGDNTPAGADAEALCMTFGRGDPETIDEVDAVLTEEEDYAVALDRHRDLVSWLGIPWEYACMCFGHIQQGHLAEGVCLDDLTATDGESPDATIGEVSLTAAAADAVKQALLDASPGSFLRFAVKSGGETGFMYDLDFDTKIDPSADQEFESCGVNLVVDKYSLRLLAGTIIDYKTGPSGSGFDIQNPNAE